MKVINPLYAKLKVYFTSVDSYNNSLLKNKTKFGLEESFLPKNGDRFSEKNKKNEVMVL